MLETPSRSVINININAFILSLCAHKPQCEVPFKWGWPTVVEIQGRNIPRLHTTAIVIYRSLTINAFLTRQLNKYNVIHGGHKISLNHSVIEYYVILILVPLMTRSQHVV